MAFVLIITNLDGTTSREDFWILSSAMHRLRECVEAKVACVLEYNPL